MEILSRHFFKECRYQQRPLFIKDIIVDMVFHEPLKLKTEKNQSHKTLITTRKLSFNEKLPSNFVFPPSAKNLKE